MKNKIVYHLAVPWSIIDNFWEDEIYSFVSEEDLMLSIWAILEADEIHNFENDDNHETPMALAYQEVEK